MAEAAEQHGRPSAPVNGEYLRMENLGFIQRFKNDMRPYILGNVAWLEFPRRKSRRRVTLFPDGGWRRCVHHRLAPASPEWPTSWLQLVVIEGERGLLEDEKKFGKLDQEYSQ